MKKFYKLLVLLILFPIASQAQYDVSITWEAYADGETVTSTTEDDLFTGAVIVRNNGIPIPIGETVYVGYVIDGVVYSLALNEGSLTGLVVSEEEWGPGVEIPVDLGSQIIIDPVIGGGEIDICAVAYGVGADALYLDFATEIAPDDNTVCVTGIVADLAAGIEDETLKTTIEVYLYQNELTINQENSTDIVPVQIMSINGQVVCTQNVDLSTGSTKIDLSHLAPGIYVVALERGEMVETKKIVIQ